MLSYQTRVANDNPAGRYRQMSDEARFCVGVAAIALLLWVATMWLVLFLLGEMPY
jgi:hypothetical protein